MGYPTIGPLYNCLVIAAAFFYDDDDNEDDDIICYHLDEGYCKIFW